MNVVIPREDSSVKVSQYQVCGYQIHIPLCSLILVILSQAFEEALLV